MYAVSCDDLSIFLDALCLERYVEGCRQSLVEVMAYSSSALPHGQIFCRGTIACILSAAISLNDAHHIVRQVKQQLLTLHRRCEAGWHPC